MTTNLIEQALQTLAVFAKTAPGRLPGKVQEAVRLAAALEQRAEVVGEWPLEADALTQLIQRLNSTPYNLTKAECIEVAKELRAALAQQARQPLTDLDLRGILASSLKCWHRLTEDEAADLVVFAGRHGVGR